MEQIFRIFYHGTTADRCEDIRRQGLLPGPGGLMYISPRLSIARKFGSIKSDLHGSPLVIYKIALLASWMLEDRGKAYKLVSQDAIPYDLMREISKDESGRVTDWADLF